MVKSFAARSHTLAFSRQAARDLPALAEKGHPRGLADFIASPSHAFYLVRRQAAGGVVLLSAASAP